MRLALSRCSLSFSLFMFHVLLHTRLLCALIHFFLLLVERAFSAFIFYFGSDVSVDTGNDIFAHTHTHTYKHTFKRLRCRSANLLLLSGKTTTRRGAGGRKFCKADDDDRCTYNSTHTHTHTRVVSHNTIKNLHTHRRRDALQCDATRRQMRDNKAMRTTLLLLLLAPGTEPYPALFTTLFSYFLLLYFSRGFSCKFCCIFFVDFFCLAFFFWPFYLI